jgi:hypothetical protein
VIKIEEGTIIKATISPNENGSIDAKIHVRIANSDYIYRYDKEKSTLEEFISEVINKAWADDWNNLIGTTILTERNKFGIIRIEEYP